MTLGQVQPQKVAKYPLHHLTYAPAKFEAAMSNCLGGNAFTRNIWYDLDARSRSHEALPSTSCDLCTCKVWSCYGQWLRRRITEKIHYLILTLRSRGSRTHKMLPSTLTSCDLCTSKVWCCYIPWLRRRCIYKKIHYLTLTLGSRSHKMLPSTLDILWPMHQQILILLHPTVKEKMHLQENTLFDLDLHTKCCPLPSTSCDLCTYRVRSYYVKSFSKEHLQENSIFDLDLGVMKCCPVPSTSCELSSYKVWSCYV